jgi:hypothetical protein
MGIGVGPTVATDHLIIKGILGRRFDWGHRREPEHKAGTGRPQQEPRQ